MAFLLLLMPTGRMSTQYTKSTPLPQPHLDPFYGHLHKYSGDFSNRILYHELLKSVFCIFSDPYIYIYILFFLLAAPLLN